MAARTCSGLVGESGSLGAEFPRLPGCFPVWESFIGGEITQTGRVHDVKNYRKIPVVGHPEEVSENFDIDLATEQLWSAVESQVTACDGGEGALGHGNVYINLNRETKTGA